MHPDELRPLAATVEGFVQRLDAAGIRWCVLRNYECFPLPRSAGSDLDILVGCRPSQAQQLLRSVAMESAVSVIAAVPHTACRMISVKLAWSVAGRGQVDLFSNVSWHGIPILDETLVLAEADFRGNARAPKAGHEAAISSLYYLLHVGRVKDEYRNSLNLDVAGVRRDFVACLQGIWGESRAHLLADRLAAQDWSWFERWVPAARRHLLLRTLCRPPLAVQLLVGTLRMGWQRSRLAPQH